MEVTVSSTDETKKLAFKVAAKLKPGDVVALFGDLGSGKTTFVRFVVEALGIKARVQSPTFVIARKYLSKDPRSKIRTINHLDLYRLQTQSEVIDLGFWEFVEEEGALTLIEWPELVENFLPDKVIRIRFVFVDENERKVDIAGLEL